MVLEKTDFEDAQSGDMLKEIETMTQRFIAVFENHDIPLTKIAPNISPEFKIKLADFKNYTTILNILSDDLLKWTSKVFEINKDWLYGIGVRIVPWTQLS